MKSLFYFIAISLILLPFTAKAEATRARASKKSVVLRPLLKSKTVLRRLKKAGSTLVVPLIPIGVASAAGAFTLRTVQHQPANETITVLVVAGLFLVPALFYIAIGKQITILWFNAAKLDKKLKRRARLL